MNGADRYTSQMEQLIDKLAKDFKEVFVGGILHVTNDYNEGGVNATEYNKKLDSYNNAIKKKCQSLSTKVHYVEIGQGLVQNGYLIKNYAFGTFHLTYEGYEKWAQNIKNAIKNNTTTTSASSSGTYWWPIGSTLKTKIGTTYFAQWTANTYTVEYNGNGNTGGSTASSSHTYDTEKALTANGYTKTGYTFAGWNTKADGTGTKYANKASVKNLTATNKGTVTLYAQWTANTYIVEYNGNGNTGGNTASSSHTYETVKELTANGYTKTGYTFAGWNTKVDGTGTKYIDKASVKNLTATNNGTVMLYAQWKINKYTLTVNPNGGTWQEKNESSEIEQEYNTTKDLGTAVPSEGYNVTFNINYEEGENPSAVKATKTFKNWTKETGEGSINGTIYKFGAGNGTVKANYQDNAIKLPIVTRIGYGFTGWYDAQEGGNKIGNAGANYIPSKDVTLYAQWKENVYTVTYNYDENGGDSARKETAEVDYGESIDLSVEAEKEGYEFVGWNTDKDATEGIESVSMPAKDVMLYAIFKKDIEVTFIDYTGEEKTTRIVSKTIYNNETYDTNALKINEYIGYKAKCWVTEDGKEVAEETEIKGITSNKTYYAVYEKNIIIRFHSNGGTGSLPKNILYTIEVSSKNIEDKNIPKVEIGKASLTREGYELIGWNTQDNGEGIAYKTGDEVKFIESTTLYAQWKKIEKPVDEGLPFTDVIKGKWYYSAIEYVYKNKIIMGYNDTTFGPNDNLTRGQLVTILWRMEGEPKITGEPKFPDVQDSKKYYYKAVKWATDNQIVSGYDDGTFGPEDDVQRQQIAVILNKYAKYKGKETKETSDLKEFIDVKEISKYADTQIRWAVGVGILHGNDDKTLNPKGSATRAEVAAMLKNYCNNIGK